MRAGARLREPDRRAAAAAEPDTRAMIDEAVASIRKRTASSPGVGIILGTGLGGLVREIDIETSIEYAEIPHFPLSTVESHHGRLIFGTLGGVPVVAMQGRFHTYEGYTMKQVTFPVRVMAKGAGLGVKTLLMSNAAGGMNPDFRRGDLMIIADHINLLGASPLTGRNDETLGPRFPDMSEPWSARLIALAKAVAAEKGIPVKSGVFVAVPGPNLETKAEYRYLRGIGADAVGMSTVPENIVAVHMGLEALGISIITDECFPDSLEPFSVEAIIRAASEAEPKLTAIYGEVVARLGGGRARAR